MGVTFLGSPMVIGAFYVGLLLFIFRFPLRIIVTNRNKMLMFPTVHHPALASDCGAIDDSVSCPLNTDPRECTISYKRHITV